jgi:lipopolysaccharide transport system permease protein
VSSQSSRTGVIIEAGGQHQRYFGDVWALRHLLWMFAWREIVLRYKQTTVGILWVVLRPLLTVAIFAVVFGRFLRVPSGDLHYPLLILSGFIPWQFVAYSFAGASESLFTHSSVISKVYFPRIIAPISVFLVNVVDLAVALLLLAILMGVYGVIPDRRLLALPLFLLFPVPGAAGLALWFAAVSAKYRDFRNVIPFVVMLTLYVSPVAFSAAVVPAEWKFWYWLNPLVAAIEGMRWSLFSGRGELYWPGMLASLMLSLAVLVLGYRYFRSVERSIVDVI